MQFVERGRGHSSRRSGFAERPPVVQGDLDLDRGVVGRLRADRETDRSREGGVQAVRQSCLDPLLRSQRHEPYRSDVRVLVGRVHYPVQAVHRQKREEC